MIFLKRTNDLCLTHISKFLYKINHYFNLYLIYFLNNYRSNLIGLLSYKKCKVFIKFYLIYKMQFSCVVRTYKSQNYLTDCKRKLFAFNKAFKNQAVKNSHQVTKLISFKVFAFICHKFTERNF